VLALPINPIEMLSSGTRPFLQALRNPGILLFSITIALIAVSIWGFILQTKLRRQTGKLATLAYLEQRRTRILADINSSKPLVEIIETITGMVSFMLDGAPCWCEVKDGARLGTPPPGEMRLIVIQEEIPARSGPPLGTLFAGLDPGVIPGVRRSLTVEKEALAGAAKLAMLAMETRRLYSDLLRRSEVDLLTNVHNRRSMGERMDALIEEAHQNASVFGLVYIDLDKFKPINDRYGHHVGDIFLQEVASRMKKQLRSHDLLARLGGDEFAVLLPMVRNRTRIEEIALRLEHCFQEPFLIDGNLIQGSASFGYSMYPEDGTTKESLLSAADTAMYAAKNIKKQFSAGTFQRKVPASTGQTPT
jgi:diguanylate cyclase (GGDEF)-like protein